MWTCLLDQCFRNVPGFRELWENGSVTTAAWDESRRFLQGKYHHSTHPVQVALLGVAVAEGSPPQDGMTPSFWNAAGKRAGEQQRPRAQQAAGKPQAAKRKTQAATRKKSDKQHDAQPAERKKGKKRRGAGVEQPAPAPRRRVRTKQLGRASSGAIRPAVEEVLREPRRVAAE
jgi:hypothetical protein